MRPHEQPLLTDQQLRNASPDQIEDLVQCINLMMQMRGMPGLVWKTSAEDQTRPSDRLDPGTIGSQ